MQNPVNSISDTYQSQLQASRQLAEMALSCTEKINQSVLNAAHGVFNEQIQFLQALMKSGDTRQIALLQASFLSHTPDCVAKSQKDILQICQDTQNQAGKAMEQYFEHASNTPFMSLPLTVPGKKGDGDMLGPVTDLFNLCSAAFREVSTLATQNLEVARSSFEKANVTILEERKAASAREKHK